MVELELNKNRGHEENQKFREENKQHKNDNGQEKAVMSGKLRQINPQVDCKKVEVTKEYGVKENTRI